MTMIMNDGKKARHHHYYLLLLLLYYYIAYRIENKREQSPWTTKITEEGRRSGRQRTTTYNYTTIMLYDSRKNTVNIGC